MGMERSRAAELATMISSYDDGDYAEHERLLARAEAVADGMNEPTRSIIRMCYYEHNTHAEAAQRLGISRETVKKHIRKALRTLRENLSERD